MAIGVAVASFFNEAEEPARLHIERILQKLRKMAALVATQSGDLSDAEVEGSQIHRESGPVLKLRLQVEELLAQYPRPRRRLSLEGSGSEYVFETKEAEIADGLITLYDKGLLDRLRDCEGDRCGKCYFARPNQQRCSDRCRHKKIEQTEHFKSYRALYAKEQYWNAVSRGLRSEIKNLSRSREDHKTKAELEERRKAALEKAEAAKRKREQLKDGKP